jgi:hypothetical protein
VLTLTNEIPDTAAASLQPFALKNMKNKLLEKLFEISFSNVYSKIFSIIFRC